MRISLYLFLFYIQRILARDSLFIVFVLNEAFTMYDICSSSATARGVIERLANMWSVRRFALLANEWRALMPFLHSSSTPGTTLYGAALYGFLSWYSLSQLSLKRIEQRESKIMQLKLPGERGRFTSKSLIFCRVI